MLSDNIRKFRKSKQMSQDELAEKLGVTRQSISLWETGQTQPSLDKIVALAELFEVSTDALLTDNHPDPVCAEAAGAPTDKPKRKKKPVFVIAICFAVIAALGITALLWGKGLNNDVADPAPPIGEGSAAASTSNPQNENKDPQTDETDANSGGDGSQGAVSENAEPVVGPSENDAEKDIYSYLKDFVIQNGTLNGDYCYYSKPADQYGGYSSEDFSLYYWGDTKTVEFCLHSVLNDTFRINFYLYVPEQHTGEYEYTSSYYYRDTGEPLYEARGVINAKEFTKDFPLDCDKYIGAADVQNEFMEVSRQGVCDLIDCLEQFIEVEQLKYSFSDFGFAAF